MGENPIYNMFASTLSRSMPSNPFGNLMGLLSQFQQFRQSFQGTPQQAHQQVQQLMNQGYISPTQFDQMSSIANSLLQMMQGR